MLTLHEAKNDEIFLSFPTALGFSTEFSRKTVITDQWWWRKLIRLLWCVSLQSFRCLVFIQNSPLLDGIISSSLCDSSKKLLWVKVRLGQIWFGSVNNFIKAFKGVWCKSHDANNNHKNYCAIKQNLKWVEKQNDHKKFTTCLLKNTNNVRVEQEDVCTRCTCILLSQISSLLKIQFQTLLQLRIRRTLNILDCKTKL